MNSVLLPKTQMKHFNNMPIDYNFLRQVEDHRGIDNLAPNIKELTNLHKFIVLIHKVGPEYKYDTISLEQYYSNNTCCKDYRHVLLLAETRQKEEKHSLTSFP
jgi:hypothetical protein